MKQLFERFEQQSLAVERVLEKSIELVRERRSPGADLCAEIDAALRDLRSVYDEITEKLPEKAGGVTLPAGASARELEALWKESAAVKRNSLISVLSEFIKVYSDDAWYLEAIQDQLDKAKGLLTQMEEDEKASPDVSSYAIFLECVKQDLEENIELAHKIEDEGINGFKLRAISGLLKKKYYIREEESAEVPSGEQEAVEQEEAEEAEESVETEEAIETEETVKLEQPKESEEPGEPGVIGYVDTVQGRVKVKIVQDTPETAAHPSKYTSRAKDRIGAMVFTLNLLINMQLLPADKVEELNKCYDALSQSDIDYLLAHGYAGKISFAVNGEEQLYYIASSKAYECFKKSTVANYVKTRLGSIKNQFPKPENLVYPRLWSAVYAYRCKLLMDYMLLKKDEYLINIYRADPLTNFPYSPHPDKNGVVAQHCTGIITKDDAIETVKFVVAYIRDKDRNTDLVIVVDSLEAIHVFCDAFEAEDEDIKPDLKFVILEDPDHRYDANGAIIAEMDDADIGTEQVEGPAEAIEVKPEEITEAQADSSAEESAQVPEMISPIQPLKKGLKTPSRKEFEDLAKKLFPVFHMICRNIGCLQIASEEMISRIIRGSMSEENASRINLKGILNSLEVKGYLASYKFPYHGSEAVGYCHTELLRSCLQKDNYRQLITSREDHKSPLPLASFVAKDQVSTHELVDRFARAEVISDMFEYQSSKDRIIKTMFCLWHEEKGCHTNKITFQSREEIDTVVVSHYDANGPVIIPSTQENILIVDRNGNLPAPEILPPAEGKRVFCINEEWFYELIDGVWVTFGDTKNAEAGTKTVLEETAEAEETTETEKQVEAEETVVEPTEESNETTIHEQEESLKETAAAESIIALQNLQKVACQAFCKGKFYAGMTLLHGLEMEDDFYHRKAEQYGFALGDPYLEQDNRFANLQSVYDRPFGEDAKYDLLAYAAYLRMYCSPTAAYDPYSINEISFLKDNIACGTFKPLNDLLNAIAHYVGRVQHGLDDKTVEAAVLKKTQLDRIPEYATKAQYILDAKLYKPSTSKKRINRMRLLLFSEGNEIASMLSVVAKDNRANVKKIREFLKGKSVGGIVEDDIIDTIMDDAWDACAEASDTKKADRFGGHERTTMQRQLREIFECLKDWADEVESGDKSKGSEAQDTLSLIQECKPYLSSALKGIQKKTTISLSIEEAASYVILEKTVALILERLEGNMTQERYRRIFYIDLLKAPFVALDEERMPVIESKEEQIYDLDFCRRVAQYVDVPDRSWPDVVKEIFTYSQDRKCFNFGCVEIIRQYLMEIGQGDQFGEYNTQKTIIGLSSPIREKQSPNKWREDYIARFEMAKSDDWFDLDTIRSIEERIKAQEEIYYSANNFGIYGRALLRMIDYFNEVAQRKKPELQHRLDVLKEKYEEIESWPIFRVIQESIDKLRFGVADSYLVQAERGSFDIVEDNQQPESKLFEEFLTKYNTYYEQAKPESGLTLEKAFTQTHPTVSTEDYKTAVTFLKYWPQKDRPSATNMDAILRSIGQEKMLDKVNYKTKEGFFIATFDEKQEYSITHPIAKFGSVMYEKGLQIAVVKGSSDLVDLVDDISAELRKMNKDIPALIIVDGAIHLDVRRQLAYQFMSKPITQVTFIILDRVLALHIANEKKATRWLRLLNCSVPFQPINPYSDDPTKEIPNEMFFGRADELKKILDTETAMLVFGGRQLGKTALLHHARNLSRDMRQGRWSSYVDVKDKKVSEAATKIGDTLVTNQREKFFVGTKRTSWTWNILINAIRDRLFVGDDCKDQFFLFIDEADAFLKDSAKHNYRELDDLLQLSTDTNYRFRFVLAGLRDVVQFHREANANNSIVSKFKRLRIPPLEFKDARNLLVIPLSYLGFTFSDDEGEIIAQILHQTNYFPGIIHFYVHKLIEQKHKAFNSSLAPSFRLERNDLLLLLKDKEFRDLRKNRLEITLELDDKDKYYYTLALLLSYFNNNEKPEGKGEDYCQYGVTAQGLLKCARGIDPTAKISKLTESQIITVLEELYELYILKKTQDEDGIEYYDFARTAFADMLGRKDEVQTKLINLMAEGGHEDE